ncbi:MAG TPA: hypothetical protein VFF30_09795 [Nitrososphaerales archaeon]|nr:hypothetical protein [Nitrososphaerales archaeon]
MPNFSVEVISPHEKILTDAVGRKVLLYSKKEARPKRASQETNVSLAVRTPLRRTIACTPIQLVLSLRLEKES